MCQSSLRRGAGGAHPLQDDLQLSYIIKIMQKICLYHWSVMVTNSEHTFATEK